MFDHSGNAHALDEAAVRSYFAGESAPEDRLFARLCGSTIIRDDQITELSVDASEASRFSLVRDTLGSTQLPDIEGRLKKAKQVLDARVKRLESEYELVRSDVNRLITQTSEARSGFEAEPDSEKARRELAVALKIAEDRDTDDLMRQARGRTGRLHNRISTLSRSIPRLQEIERRRAEMETDAYRARGRELNEELGRSTEAERLAQDARKAAEQAAGQFKERRPHIRSLGELVEHGKRVGLEDSRCPLCGSEITEDSFESHLHAAGERVDRESEGLLAVLTRRRRGIES